MALTLLSKDRCPFCWQVKMAMAYLDIEYELKEWAAPDKELLLRYSPQGSSPILLVDDFAIWDSNSIIYYLDDISEHSTLFPGDATDKASSRLLQYYSNILIGKDLREVIFEKRSKPKSDWDMERIQKGEAGWRNCLDWLENEIESTNSFIEAGFSIADAALLPRFGLAEYYGVGVSKLHSKLYNWYLAGKQSKPYQSTTPFSEGEVY